MTQICFRGILA